MQNNNYARSAGLTAIAFIVGLTLVIAYAVMPGQISGFKSGRSARVGGL